MPPGIPDIALATGLVAESAGVHTSRTLLLAELRLLLAVCPASTGVDSPAFVHVYVDDIDAHHARAKEAGAEITREPEDQFYGDRTYGAKDPQGMSWYFAQHVREMSAEEMGPA